MMNCQQCGAEAAPGANFCMSCGVRLQLRCHACQTPYSPGSRFCGHCGVAFAGVGGEATPAADPGTDTIPCPRCHRTNAPGAAYCFACGLPFEGVQPGIPYARSSGASDYGLAALALGRPGGVWLRLLAYVVDGLIVTFAFILIWTTLLGQPFSDITEPLELGEDYEYSSQAFNRDGLNSLLALVYDTALIAIWATTVGKRLFRLYVVRTDGSRVGPGRALARHLASLLSMLILGIGFLMIAFRQDKRGLHDLICDTVVIRRYR